MEQVYTGQSMPFLSPNQQCHSTEGNSALTPTIDHHPRWSTDWLTPGRRDTTSSSQTTVPLTMHRTRQFTDESALSSSLKNQKVLSKPRCICQLNQH